MKPRNRRTSKKPVARVATSWASNGVGLAQLSNEAALKLAKNSGHPWDILSADDGSGDIIRMTVHAGVPVVCYVRGSDHRCLLGSPIHEGDEQPGGGELLAALRELSEIADKTEREAREGGRWDAIDPRRVPGQA